MDGHPVPGIFEAVFHKIAENGIEQGPVALDLDISVNEVFHCHSLLGDEGREFPEHLIRHRTQAN